MPDGWPAPFLIHETTQGIEPVRHLLAAGGRVGPRAVSFDDGSRPGRRPTGPQVPGGLADAFEALLEGLQARGV